MGARIRLRVQLTARRHRLGIVGLALWGLAASASAAPPNSGAANGRAEAQDQRRAEAQDQRRAEARDRSGLDAEALLGRLEAALGGQIGALDVQRAGTSPARPGSPAPAAAPADRESLQGTYRYRGAKGREVFTNVLESVPLDQRADSELDLSNVPLNTELGTQINARLTAEHERLLRTDYCREAQQRSEGGALWALWDRYSPILITGAFILFFILITPAMFRRVSVPEWVRTLRFAVPVLAVSGLVLYSMMEANRGISDLVAREAPCERDTWERLGKREHPLAARLALVQALRAQMLAANDLSKHVQATDRGL